MRNLKKLLAVVVAVCVLATFTVPAFAADAKTDAQICTDIGVLKGAGSGVTAAYLTTTPDRLQGAIMFLRLKGLEDTAKAFLGTDNFADVDGMNDTNQAILAYLKANPDLGFEGTGDNNFAPTEKMTAKQYYKVMLVALGYVYNTDFTWNNVFTFAAGKGILKLIDNESFTVNDLAIATVEALKTPVKGGTDTLITTLVKGGSITAAAATTAGIYTAAPATLTVVSATADNLIAAKVVFNAELDSATVTKANISATGVSDVKLLADKKTVLVIYAAAKAQSATSDITIENVKSTAGVKITKVTKTVTFVDTTIPVVSGAIATNPKTVKLAVNEPVVNAYTYDAVMSEIKIDGTAAIGKLAVNYSTNELVLTLYTLLTAGTHKIEIKDIKDFAGYTAVATTFNFDVAADTTAPAISSAKANNQNEIEVTFNEDLSAIGSFKVDGTAVTSATAGADANKVILVPAAPLNIGATVEIAITYKDQKDVVGNKTAEATFKFKIADDTAIPTVTAAFSSANVLTLTFTKPMATAGTVAAYVGTSTTAVTHVVTTSSFKVDTNKTVIELPAATFGLSGIASKAVKLVIKDMKDATIRNNPMAETTLNLTANDTELPVVTTTYSAVAATTGLADDTVTFYFSEAMDPTTLNNLSNYVMTSSTAISLASVSGVKVSSVASDNMSVTIVVPGIGTASGQTFLVYAMKDTAGNLMATNTTPITRKPINDALAMLTATATAVNTVELGFSAPVKSFSTAEFFVMTNSNNTTGSAFIIGYSISGSKVTVTLNSDLSTSPNGNYWIGSVAAPANTKNFLGTASTKTAIVNNGVPIVDKVKPTVTVAAATSSSILLTFSEDMNVAGGTTTLANDVVVRKADGTLVALTNANFTLLDSANAPGALATSFRKAQITGLTAVTGYTVEVLNRSLVDTNANVVTPLAATAVTTN